jgi:hypothetical protein
MTLDADGNESLTTEVDRGLLSTPAEVAKMLRAPVKNRFDA